MSTIEEDVENKKCDGTEEDDFSAALSSRAFNFPVPIAANRRATYQATKNPNE